ncbi:MAG: conjugal transfer pilus assembly protein TraU [Gammaproteobacteria bacterium]|nr:conjugal transfer pilus assembly protein TraU [Gammaproteobacteria bacterium]
MSAALFTLLLLAAPLIGHAQGDSSDSSSSNYGECSGEMINPISDVCWECIFPISIGSTPIVSGDNADPPNPGNLICTCPAPPPLFVSVGISVGFWEPARMADVVRKPYCFPGLGGMQLDAGVESGMGDSYSTDGETHTGTWHVHWYIYPLLYLLNMITDSVCKDSESFDIAYITELDPTWLDDELGFILNPEAVLFANPIAQAACAADCIAASVHLPIDPLFWCAGCQGSMYPLGGRVQAHVGSIQSSLLAVERMNYKLHRQLFAKDTSGPEALCGSTVNPIIEKSSYRSQLTNPVAMSMGRFGCNPYGRTTTFYETKKEIPVVGEDFSYLVWRKRNCCVRY